MNLLEKLTPIVGRHRELASKMSQENLSGEEFVAISKEYASLTEVVEAIEAYQKAVADRKGAQEMLADPEMADMAQVEFDELNKKIPQLEHEIKLALIPKDVADERSA